MTENITRRETLRRGLAATTVFSLMSELSLPALAQGDVDVPFTDYPPNYGAPAAPGATRMYDIRTIDGMFTPKEKFFAINHFNRPEIDASSYRLKITGMVNKPTELSLTELQGMAKASEVVAGYECSGNSPRAMQGLTSCGKFTGVKLSTVLKKIGVSPKAEEVVFFGADRGEQEVVFRQNTYKLNQQFGRSMTLENAMKPEPMLAWALNGDPLRTEQGFPLRLVVPGRYGVSNVKWLSEIHLQDERYLGNYQARWYRSVRGIGGNGEDNDPNTQWVEAEITRLQLKSVVARVRKAGNAHTIHGFILNDGTPIKSVEVQIDGGDWQKASIDPGSSQYSWKLFTYKWEGAKPGEHTIVSRVTDVEGRVQPTAAELVRKKTFLQDNSQMPRKVKIA